MPGSGFGYAPFGEFPFGEWPWGRFAIIQSFPKKALEFDKAGGGQLEEFLDAIATEMEVLRAGATGLETLRDPLTARSQYDDVLRLRLGPIMRPMGTLIGQGVTGTIAATQVFSDTTLRVQEEHIGATLRIFSSTIPANNREVRISSLVTVSQVLTDPPLQVDAGPLRWELRTTEPSLTDCVTVQVRGGDVSRVYPGWILTDGIAYFEVKARRRFLRDASGALMGVQRQGEDGSVTVAGYLSSSLAVFSQDDVGRLVSINVSTFPTNNGRFWIKEVISPTVARLNVLLTQDSGPFEWALYSFSELDLVGLAVPRGIVTQEGFDLSVTAPTIIKAPNGRFSALDIGKELTLQGSAIGGNNGIFTVSAVPAIDQLQVVGTLTIEAGPLRWELRTPTFLSESDEVELAAPSMLEILAKDFGITIDRHESEYRQRLYVETMQRWSDMRGSALGYEVLGKISGFEVSVKQLFRVSQDIFLLLIPSGNNFEVGDIEEGHFGTDGALELVSGKVRLRSASALFTVAMEGRSVRVRNSVTGSNDKLYQIDAWVSANLVEIRVADTAITPEYGIGGQEALPTLEWRVVDLLTDLAPCRPCFDELNGDVLTSIVGPTAFHLDIFCWDPDYLVEVTVNVLSVVQVSPQRYLVTVEGNADVVVAPGKWALIDANGVRNVLETMPVQIFAGIPPQFTFELIALPAPVLGAAILRYICSMQLTCDYCASSRLLAVVEMGDILSESGFAIERARERVLERLETQAKQIRVDLIPLLRDYIEISFGFTVEVESGAVTSHPILIPFAYYFDETPADAVVLDGSWGVEVETP